MTWQWVCVLVIVVIAWTVHKVTQMWQTVCYYKYATNEVKDAIFQASLKGSE